MCNVRQWTAKAVNVADSKCKGFEGISSVSEKERQKEWRRKRERERERKRCKVQVTGTDVHVFCWSSV